MARWEQKQIDTKCLDRRDTGMRLEGTLGENWERNYEIRILSWLVGNTGS